MKRRTFIKAAAASGSLILGYAFLQKNSVAAVINALRPEASTVELNAFVMIDSSGKVTIVNSHPEIGQGTYQSIPMIIAEELDVALDDIKIIQSDGNAKFGNQLSGGSSSVHLSWDALRKVGAAAREMLIEAAAKRWNIAKDACTTSNGFVTQINKPNVKIAYGDLAHDASLLAVPDAPKLKQRSEYRLVGKNTKRMDINVKTNGAAQFGLDVRIPEMLYAAIVHCPTIFGTVVSIDDKEARNVSGVIDVLIAERTLPHRSCQCVAVVAETWYGALQGKNAVRVEWKELSSSKLDSAEYFQSLAALAKQDGVIESAPGDFKSAFSSAATTVINYYETPFLAHAPLEPENAIASVGENSCEVWAPVQDPVWAARDVANYLKIPVKNVKVNVPFVGGAFGRKAYHDYLLEAVFLSKKLQRPVKVIWTREDDITQGPFRPGVGQAFAAGVDKASGTITAFQHKVICASIVDQTKFEGGLTEGKADNWVSHEGLYPFDNARYEFVLEKTDIPIVWWRSVYESNIIFGYESFVDELANATNKDPLDFRLALLKSNTRAAKVLEVLREKTSHIKLSKERSLGIAVSPFAGSYCAHAIVVSGNSQLVKIESVTSVIDCGLALNPDNVKAQTEGNIVMGLTAALKDGIVIERGKVIQRNFHNYRMLRFNEMPSIDVHVIESDEKPSGVGETALPAVAPALCNAIFRLTGKRMTRLPVNLGELG